MTGWGQQIDDLAGAVADLLTDASVRTSPLTDPAAALACRDTVVIGLRQLVGAVADMPPVAQARPLQLFDVTNRPAQALQQALAELPRASEFGATNASSYLEKGLPPYEQLWRDAARAALGLEGYVQAHGQVPDRHSWSVLRDLADLAAAIPALDHDLSEEILPGLKSGQDLAVPYAMLTHRAHDAVRVCSTEIRSRVPAVPATTTSVSPAAASSALGSTASVALVPAVLGAGELDAAMDRYVRTVLDRGSHLSIGDLCAVTRLVQFGGTDAAVALERAQRVVAGADVAAAALRELAPLVEQLRKSPAKTLGPESLSVLRGSGELQARLGALATQGRALPGGASDTALRCLAAPALEFARHVPNLARALEIGVRESLAAGLMLVPSAADSTNQSNLLWVPHRDSGGAIRDGMPVVQQQASAVARAAERVPPAVRTAQAMLDQHQAQVVDPAGRAAAQARRHVGAARAQLREVLAQQAGIFPPPLSSPLLAHPRLAPDEPVSGRGR
ncbi:MAG: hypothetical protein H7323_08575 [Frankiales bacterium]|nr:hypothetical protein [Frankiales bacterium]